MNMRNLIQATCALALSLIPVDGMFDLVSTHGVLHHLADPSAGFRAVQGVMRVGAAMDCMLYGTVGRVAHGLFRLQKAIRLVIDRSAPSIDKLVASTTNAYEAGTVRAEAELRIAASVLDTIPKNHPHDPTVIGDVQRWEGLADLYMHPMKHTYTTTELYDLVADTMTYNGFADAATAANGANDANDALAPMVLQLQGGDKVYHPANFVEGIEYDDQARFTAKHDKRLTAHLNVSDAARLGELLTPERNYNHFFYLLPRKSWLPERFKYRAPAGTARVKLQQFYSHADFSVSSAFNIQFSTFNFAPCHAP